MAASLRFWFSFYFVLFFFAILDIPVCTCLKYLFLNYNHMKEILDLRPSEKNLLYAFHQRILNNVKRGNILQENKYHYV